jgi:hypothetical protein
MDRRQMYHRHTAGVSTAHHLNVCRYPVYTHLVRAQAAASAGLAAASRSAGRAPAAAQLAAAVHSRS